MSASLQPERADGGRGRFRKLEHTVYGRRFPALMRILSLILAVRQL